MNEKTLTIQAGKNALNKLENLIECLHSAKKWGTFDVFSKDLLPTLIKRSKLKKSEIIAEEASVALNEFKTALQSYEDMKFQFDEIVESTKMIDYFLGFIGNIFVLDKINININETKKIYDLVQKCVKELESNY